MLLLLFYFFKEVCRDLLSKIFQYSHQKQKITIVCDTQTILNKFKEVYRKYSNTLKKP